MDRWFNLSTCADLCAHELVKPHSLQPQILFQLKVRFSGSLPESLDENLVPPYTREASEETCLYLAQYISHNALRLISAAFHSLPFPQCARRTAVRAHGTNRLTCTDGIVTAPVRLTLACQDDLLALVILALQNLACQIKVLIFNFRARYFMALQAPILARHILAFHL
ncbi:hypothetical protein WMY93_029842 [Mugilogobius chulae]|uniref:Uncharacterized protein n=1 Tax=Mugilogobius chulae TaxID=88201 RepID=A0AAW0MKZ5_9GOBI